MRDSLMGKNSAQKKGQMQHSALVTGASSGIGEAIVRRLVADGHRVVLAARRLEKLRSLAQEIDPTGKQAFPYHADITIPEDRIRLVQYAMDVMGSVTLLVNNAGIAIDEEGIDWWNRETTFHRVLQTDLIAPIELIRLVLPSMIASKSGHIINIGSIAGQIAAASMYTTSKFGLRGLSLSLRHELKSKGVHVSLISPGFILTDLIADLPSRILKTIPGPKIVANAVARVLKKPRAEVIVPGIYRILLEFHRIFPGLTERLFAKSSDDLVEKLYNRLYGTNNNT